MTGEKSLEFRELSLEGSRFDPFVCHSERSEESRGQLRRRISKPRCFALLSMTALVCVLSLNSALYATDTAIKERIPYKKPVRVRIPPQLLIDAIREEFQSKSPLWRTFWQNFVVEDDEIKDEFVIIARSVERNWAFAIIKEDCPKPFTYERLVEQVSTGGTPVRMDVLVGIKRKRSFFRYVVQVYQPMYEHWKNPCFVWNLPPGMAQDNFYKENYTMKSYSENLSKKVYDLVERYSRWKPPKQVTQIPAIRGKEVELIGGEAEELTDEEKLLPIFEQEKILEKRKKQQEKREKKEKKVKQGS